MSDGDLTSKARPGSIRPGDVMWYTRLDGGDPMQVVVVADGGLRRGVGFRTWWVRPVSGGRVRRVNATSLVVAPE